MDNKGQILHMELRSSTSMDEGCSIYAHAVVRLGSSGNTIHLTTGGVHEIMPDNHSEFEWAKADQLEEMRKLLLGYGFTKEAVDAAINSRMELI